MTFLVTCAVVVAAAVIPRPATPAQEFDRGRTAFQRGEYERAISLIYPLVYPELRLESEGEVLIAHRLLGVSYLFVNKPNDARIEFRKLLELAPDYRFDALLDPPRVVEFFNALVREQQEQLGDIEARLRKREEQRNRHLGEILVRRVERRPYAVNFLPFGAGQFQNEQHTKGWLFLGAEALLGAVSLGAFITNFTLYGTSPERECIGGTASYVDNKCPAAKVDHSREQTSHDITRVQVVSGAAFFAVALWGVIDAVRNYRPEVPLGDSYIPANGAPETAPASNKAGPSAWRISPLIGPLAQGGALTLTF